MVSFLCLVFHVHSQLTCLPISIDDIRQDVRERSFVVSNGEHRIISCLMFNPIQNLSLLLLMEEILHQLIWRNYHYLQGFIHLSWCRISSINSSSRCFTISPRLALYTGMMPRMLHAVPSAAMCWGSGHPGLPSGRPREIPNMAGFNTLVEGKHRISWRGVQLHSFKGFPTFFTIWVVTVANLCADFCKHR